MKPAKQSDLFFRYYFKEGQVCEKKTKDHILVYIFCGNIITEEKGIQQIIHSGEWVFIPKGNTLYLQPEENKDFISFVLTFTPRFLKYFHQQVENSKTSLFRGQRDIIRLVKTPDTQSLYYSLLPYYYYEKDPLPEILQLKLQVGIYCIRKVLT